MNDLSQKARSFWDRPEGKVGAVVAAALIVGGGIVFYRVLPFLIKMAQNTLHLIFLLAVIGAIAYVVLDPRNRAMAFFAYRMIMRKITGLFIQLDPIAILKIYVDSLKENLSKMDEQIRKLKGTMATLRRTIEQNEEAAQNNMALASKAKETGKEKIMVLQARKAGRLQKSNVTLKGLYTKMEIIYRVLAKMYENCQLLLEDTEDQVQLKESEWKAIQQSHKAMRSAMNIISGDKDKRAIYEEALEFMADDLGNKIGEMERFMELSEGFMDGIDLQNGVFEEKGLEMLENWERSADSWILGADKPLLIEQAKNPGLVLDLNSPVAATLPVGSHNNQFSKLFT